MSAPADHLHVVGDLDTAELVARVEAVIRRYVVLPDDHAVTALALFVLHTWTIASAHATPYFVVISPEKQSGKSRLLETLALIVREPWHTASVTEAAVFRKIERDQPTLLLDEIDAVFAGATERTEALRSVLNAGNRRGAVATRVVGQGTKMDIKDFKVFCAKVLAGIDTGKLPDTIRDRAIVIRLHRRRTDELVARLRIRHAENDVKPLRADLNAWATAHLGELTNAEPMLPDSLPDRAADAWEPLLAIADLASDDMATRARKAAIVLSGGEMEEASDGYNVMLLQGIRTALADRAAITTDEILEAVNKDETLPFGHWNERRGLDNLGLGRMLKPYGLKAKSVRVGSRTFKGHNRAALGEIFARYLPADPTQDTNPTHENPHCRAVVSSVSSVSTIDDSGELAPKTPGFALLPSELDTPDTLDTNAEIESLSADCDVHALEAIRVEHEQIGDQR